jgi:CDP-paratose 2-epimerase
VVKVKKVLVTGSSGLIGAEAVRYFDAQGFVTHGIDNNMRKVFFGAGGDTHWSLELLRADTTRFTHHDIDIRDRDAILRLFAAEKFDAVLHCAAQPSHDKARDIPFLDFEVNAVGTLNLLEANRQHSPDAPFAFMSTNKVYGDRPNSVALRELPTRWDYADPAFADGIAESFPIDQSMHSLFGASKVAADVMVQEYGRYFGMPTCCLRGGCLTGPGHSGVELHGFLSYLVKCNIEQRLYRVYGYGGKQVRDNIHAHDVVAFAHRFFEAPRAGEVYNMGGGRANSVSIAEAFSRVEALTGIPWTTEYVEQARAGDHICYISDLAKARAHYPGWDITKDLDSTLREIVDAWSARLKHA